MFNLSKIIRVMLLVIIIKPRELTEAQVQQATTK